MLLQEKIEKAFEECGYDKKYGTGAVKEESKEEETQ